MSFWVYILASRRNGTLYVGQTDDIARRVFEHRQKLTPGFTARYDVTRLVWYEELPTRDEARTSEARIKKWNRACKLELIEKMNPDWDDLYDRLNC